MPNATKFVPSMIVKIEAMVEKIVAIIARIVPIIDSRAYYYFYPSTLNCMYYGAMSIEHYLTCSISLCWTDSIPAHIDSDSVSSAHSDPPPSSGEEDEEGAPYLHQANFELNGNPEDELVIPATQHDSWSTDAVNGRSLMLEIDDNGTSVQLSIQTQSVGGMGNPRNLAMDLTDVDDDPSIEEVSN